MEEGPILSAYKGMVASMDSKYGIVGEGRFAEEQRDAYERTLWGWEERMEKI